MRRVGTLGREQHVRRAGASCARAGGRTAATAAAKLGRPGVRAPGRRERAGERGLLVEQLLRAVAHAPRLAHEHERVARQEVGQEVLGRREPRQPRLHAVEGLALGESLPRARRPTVGSARAARGALAHLGASAGARGRGRSMPRVDVVGRALVRDGERGEPVDLVAPEVDADGVVVGDRVHVDDRPAHRDLASRLDLVLAPVPHRDEPLDELVAVDPLAGPHDDRLDVLDVRAEPLHQRPDRRDEHRRERLAARCAGATAPGAAGPSSRATATPARTAGSPRPGTARSRRAGGTARGRARAARPRRAVGTATRIGRRVVTPASAAMKSGAGAVGNRDDGRPGDDGAHRRLLGEERGQAGEGRGGDRGSGA